MIDKIKNIILENNFFDTMSGERFKEFYDLNNISAVISFSGRSKNQECYKLPNGTYVTHLYINKYGDIKVQVSNEDTDDFSILQRPSNIAIEKFDNETIRKWVELLKI